MSQTDVSKLAEPLRSLVSYALWKAKQDGVPLSVTSAFRSRDEQIAARMRNCGTSQHAIYEMSSSSCRVPTAKPGTSRHESGNAIDMGPGEQGRTYMAKLLRPYGVTRPVRGESWHFEWRGVSPQQSLTLLARDIKRQGVPDSDRDSILSTIGGAIWSGPFGIIGDLIPSAGDVAGAILPDSVGAVFSALTSPEFWRRVGLGTGGVILIGLGANLVFRDVSTDVLKGVLK